MHRAGWEQAGSATQPACELSVAAVYSAVAARGGPPEIDSRRGAVGVPGRHPGGDGGRAGGTGVADEVTFS